MNKIDVNNYRINDIFTKFYVVPDYQREYVWTKDNYQQLLQDITEEYQNNGNSEYFIGSIVVCEREEDNRLDVIDGQQRLTTLFLCLAAFKKILEKNSSLSVMLNSMLSSTTIDSSGKIHDDYRLELQYKDTKEIIKCVTEDDVDKEFQSPSSQRIKDAYLFIKEYIRTTFSDETSAFLGYFLNHVKLVQIETPKISDALKIFETINERGVGLNPMDLLKNLIFRQVDKGDFEELKDEWKKVISTLETKKEKPLRFLRYFIMANYNVNIKGEEIIREDEIYKWITDDANALQIGYEEKPFEFVNCLLDNAESYVAFWKGLDSYGKKNVYFENITLLGGGSFRQHLILMLAARNMNSELLNHLAKQIETLMFYYFITKENTKEFERKFSKWAKIVSTIKTKEELNKFITEALAPEVSSLEDIFKRNFLSISLNVMQVYRIKYILARITEFIDRSYFGNHQQSELSSFIMSEINIEHILPKNPEEELRQSFGKDYDEYKVKLGNLTLFERPDNIVAKNTFFVNKQKLYKDSKFYLTRTLAEFKTVGINSSVNRTNAILKEYSKWDKESIDSRQEVLYNIAKEIWKVEVLP